MRYIIILIFSYFQNYAQLKNENYFQLGGEGPAKILIFENDSLAKIVPRSSHNLFPKTTILKYTKDGNTLSIESGEEYDKLEIVDNALVNYNKRIVYVLEKDFEKNPQVYVYYKNSFIHTGKVRRELKRKLKKSNNEIKIKIVSGFDAYEKYGYKYSFGVIEVN